MEEDGGEASLGEMTRVVPARHMPDGPLVRHARQLSTSPLSFPPRVHAIYALAPTWKTPVTRDIATHAPRPHAHTLSMVFRLH